MWEIIYRLCFINDKPIGCKYNPKAEVMQNTYVFVKSNQLNCLVYKNSFKQNSLEVKIFSTDLRPGSQYEQ